MLRQIMLSWFLVLTLTSVGWGQDKTNEKPYLVLDAGATRQA